MSLDGEFKVSLIDLEGVLYPHLEAFGEAAGSLRRALDAGLLDVLGPVADHGEFTRRLLSLGMIEQFVRSAAGRWVVGSLWKGNCLEAVCLIWDCVVDAFSSGVTFCLHE